MEGTARAPCRYSGSSPGRDSSRTTVREGVPPRTRRLRVCKENAMAFAIRSVEYYYANVRDELGAAYRVLSQLAELGVNLLAFTAVPSGPSLAQFPPLSGGSEQAGRRGARRWAFARRPVPRAARPGRRRARCARGAFMNGSSSRRGHLRVRGRDRRRRLLRLRGLRARGAVREGRERPRV